MADNPIKYSDFIKEDDSITNLIKQLEELKEVYAEMLGKVKTDAVNAEKAIKEISVTTTQGQEATKKAATESDKLTKAHEDLTKAQSDNAREVAALKAQQQQQNQINKLTIQLNNSADGSYNRLSAQYSLNKKQLNAMSLAERETTEAGKALVIETKAIYDQMKLLQASTGVTSLNVGNYEEATISLRTQLKQNTQALADMALKGQEGTQAYQRLLEETGRLRDAMDDSRAAVRNMASDTSNLDAVLSGASAASGGFSVFTGAAQLAGMGSEDLEKAQATLQSTIAITTGLQALQNAVQKDSALMVGLSKIQTYALAKAEAYRRLIQIQGTSATVGATIAQRAFNIVAAANPYVLLAIALITVVGAMVLFANGSKSAAERQIKLNEAQKAYIDLLDVESDKVKEVNENNIKALESDLAIAKSRGASTKDIYRIEDTIARARKTNHADQTKVYANELIQLDQNKNKLLQYRIELAKLQTAKAGGKKKIEVDLELNGNITKAKIDDAIEAIQGKIDNYGKLVEIGVKLSEEQKQLDENDKTRAADRIKAAKEATLEERDILRKSEDAKIETIQNAYDKQKKEIEKNYARQKQDLQTRLDNDKNLTQKSTSALHKEMASLEIKKNRELKDLTDKDVAEKLTHARASQDLQISLMAEGYDKEKITTEIEYNRKIEDLKIQLSTERGITLERKKQISSDIESIEEEKNIQLTKLSNQNSLNVLAAETQTLQNRISAVKEGSEEELNLKVELLKKQKSTELLENSLKAKEIRVSEQSINDKYDKSILKQTSDFSQTKAMLIFDKQQSLEETEFNLLRNSEAEKTKFKLEQEKARLQKILDLNKTAADKLAEVEVQAIKNTIARISKEIKSNSDKNIDLYALVGLKLDEDQRSAISDSTQFSLDNLNSIMQSRVTAAQTAVTAANTEVDAAQKKVDSEITARENGYASNVSVAQKELDMAKKNQEKALKEQAKAQKAQAAIETIQQASSLITASAKIWGALGFPWAIPALVVMWGSFAAAKIKAAQVTKTASYGDGGLEFLEGGSHASGNDIAIGMTVDGKNRRAEGGEALAIIRKSQAQKYRKILPGIISALNKGVFEQKYMNSYNTDGLMINVQKSNNDLKLLENTVNDIKKQGEHKFFVDGKGRTVETYKNLRRTYNA